MLFFSVQGSATSSAGSALALLVLIAAIAGWFGLRAVVRRLQAGKTESVVRGAFLEYALAALVNAAKLDGRANDVERAAIAAAMRDIAGAEFEAGRVEAAFASATLNKDELVAYLAERAGVFSREQKVQLLKALLSVFVADGRFDETEHHALIDYTAAIGFDRQNAPQMLRGLARDFARGNIT
jgi:uncharacterized membrane protein YebE (DUF533 family)